jgi:hypothetical protein
VCLVSGLMQVGTGSTHNNPRLVQNARRLGWFSVEILLENVGSRDSSKTSEPFRPTSSPPSRHPCLIHSRLAQGRAATAGLMGRGTPPTYPPTLIPRLPPVVIHPLPCCNTQNLRNKIGSLIIWFCDYILCISTMWIQLRQIIII